MDGHWQFSDASWEAERRSLRMRRAARPAPLTPTERRVLSLVVCGASNDEAAFLLGTQRSTVGTHLTAINRKLAAETLQTMALGLVLQTIWETP